MLDFFLALFGGMYYSSKYMSEKSKIDATEAKTKAWIDNMNSDYDRWIRRVVDDQYEYKIGQLQREDERCVRMINRIKSETGINDVSDEMVFMGILAQRKVIPKSIAMYGIHSSGVWDYAEKMLWSQQRKFLVWYDKELQKHGIEPLLFVEGGDRHNVRHDITVAQPVSATNKMIGGLYFWEPMRLWVD